MNAYLSMPAFAALTFACPSPSQAAGQVASPSGTMRTTDSSRVTIHRDAWGVPHIYGPPTRATDIADTVCTATRS